MAKQQQHPNTPPPELRSKWFNEAPKTDLYDYIIEQASQWGADLELEACCEWFQEFYKTESWVKHDLKHFRTARRPKPPSLKEQALAALLRLNRLGPDLEDEHTIRRALEALDD